MDRFIYEFVNIYNAMLGNGKFLYHYNYQELIILVIVLIMCISFMFVVAFIRNISKIWRFTIFWVKRMLNIEDEYNTGGLNV